MTCEATKLMRLLTQAGEEPQDFELFMQGMEDLVTQWRGRNESPAPKVNARKYPVEKNVPPPAGIDRAPCAVGFPWAQMNVGDSFFAPGRDARGIGSSAWAAGIRHRKRFRCRTVVEKGVPGARVWCVGEVV